MPLTIFTAANLDRLAALEAQCKSWPGPYVAAVYVPLRVKGGNQRSMLTPAHMEELERATRDLKKVIARCVHACIGINIHVCVLGWMHM